MKKARPWYTEKRFVVLGAGVVLLLAAAWYLYPGSGAHTWKPGDKLAWYCPECGQGMPCPPGQENKPKTCPRCGKGHIMEVMTDADMKVLTTGGGHQASAFFPVTMGGSIVLMVLAWYLYKPSGAAQEDQQLYSFTCKGCGRRIAYRASRAGGKALCPRCKATVTYPPPESATKVEGPI